MPVLVGLALAASAGAAPRPGKVVRIDRKPAGITGAPRFCTVSASDLGGYCVTTRPPEVGDRMHVIDNARVLGTVRVTAVTELGDGCMQKMVWMYQSTLDTGDLSPTTGAMIAVADVPLDPRSARLVDVEHSPAGHPWGTDTIYGIDSNGNGHVDLAFVHYMCDDAGNVSNLPTSSCHEVWTSRPGRGLQKLRGERYRNCY
jgi:hypothetical protein